MPLRRHRIHLVLLCLGAAIAACSCGERQGSGNPPASSAAVAAPASAASDTQAAGFHCFSWVHGSESSTDCYAGRAECERERRAMQEGARETTECKKADHVSCVRLSRPPSTTEIERCFGDARACERYQEFVRSSGHKVTACMDR